MKLKIKATDPDIFSICNRIDREILDLKPNFQRGDVWNSTKKKLLIDSILRDWQVPPVHVIRTNNKQEVLDGQQRLRAIYDFYNGKFTVNGKIEPFNEMIFGLQGMRYSDLPEVMKLQFDHYSVRVFEITDYSLGEPGELFNRLNNALNLTSAEKRNAFVGKVTNQAKQLVNILNNRNLDSKFLGFSNQRMAYDDLLIKICFMLEKDGLSTALSDKSLNDRYKSDEKFSNDIFKSISKSINLLADIKDACIKQSVQVHVTKATAFSWIYFIAELYLKVGNNLLKEPLIETFLEFEGKRAKYRNHFNFEVIDKIDLEKSALESIFDLYNQRASSKVMTYQSMLIRQLLIMCFYYYLAYDKNQLDAVNSNYVGKLISLIKENKSDAKFIIAEYVANSLERVVNK